MTMSLDSHEKLFVHELKDLYSAENQLIEALPKVIKAVNSPELKEALTAHLEETKNQAKRIEKIFKDLDFSPSGVKCAGMEGLIKEGDEMMKEDELPVDLLTDTLISGSQKIELYEIVAYTSAINAAYTLGHEEAAAMLEESLTEEENALEKLEELSTSRQEAA
jgi:ferritin-like metal-binding protein YciE